MEGVLWLVARNPAEQGACGRQPSDVPGCAGPGGVGPERLGHWLCAAVRLESTRAAASWAACWASCWTSSWESPAVMAGPAVVPRKAGGCVAVRDRDAGAIGGSGARGVSCGAGVRERRVRGEVARGSGGSRARWARRRARSCDFSPECARPYARQSCAS